MEPLSLGYSPCPNDTYIFSAWVAGRIAGAPPVVERLEDIDTLNRLALERRMDVVKVSFHALGYLLDGYRLLHSGGALGRGCGPLVVAREPWKPEELKGKRVAIPGKLTTAALLFRLFAPEINGLTVLPFHEIMPAIRDGAVDAGLIIHEGRFTFSGYGLHQVVDLGEWWEARTGRPIPLGGIAIRADLGPGRAKSVDRAISASLEHAREHPDDVWPTIRIHAQEMDDDVMRRHIDLYVNEYSREYGPEGESAIRFLFQEGRRLDILPDHDGPLFWDD